MAITAKSRALTALQATTALKPADTLAIVKQAAEAITETGIGRKDGKLSKTEVRVRVRGEQDGRLELMIGSEHTTSPGITFSAEAVPADDDVALRVGGLETYRTFQTKTFGLIPTGPATILHFGLYKRFLKEAARRLEAADPSATTALGVPGQ